MKKDENTQTEKKILNYMKVCIVALLIIFAIVTLLNCLQTIPTGFVGVKTRFGKVQDTMINEGINLKVPYIEKIVKIDCRTQKHEITTEASSKDLQKVSDIKVVINYNVDKTKANQLYKEIGVGYKTILIEPAILESIKQSMSQYTAEELITKRNEVSNIMLTQIKEKLENRGILVSAVNLTDLAFSAEFDAAVEKKQIVEQQTQQAKYELEKAKVENEKKIENAKAEAEVMKQQNSQITEQTLKLKELEIQEALIQKWNGELPSTVSGDSIPFLNIN